MGNLFNIGRIFYGIAIAGMGVQAACDKDFPYMLLPPNHSLIPGFAVLAVIFGVLLILAGASIVFEKKARQISLLLGALLLLIFCFYYVPYQLMTASAYIHFGEWENAAKELALSAGAFVIACGFSESSENALFRFLGKLAPVGTILFALTILSFGVDHFLYAKEAAGYVPSWIPAHIFWMYFCGAALLGSAIAIILKIKTGLFAGLLGTMIFLWVISLHVPRVIAAPPADRPGEITSTFLALAYCGIAFVIAGAKRKAV